MNLTRCSNGHFYDQDKYGVSCPHCGGLGMAIPQNKDVVSKNNSLQKAVASAIGSTIPSDDDDKTVSLYHKAMGSEPVVGWLVCVEGNHFGEDFRLKTGRNFIGRSPQMDVVISGDRTVSRDKHAAIIYDPKKQIFLIQPGESKELCYLNDALLLAPQEMKIYDLLTVGETQLMFFPCCTSEFNWDMVKR